MLVGYRSPVQSYITEFHERRPLSVSRIIAMRVVYFRAGKLLAVKRDFFAFSPVVAAVSII